MTAESKPTNTVSVESVPSRGGLQDGAWTEVGQDGAWTEERGPDGAYTQDNSYLKEFKPIWTIFTKESLPSGTLAAEGVPSNTRTKEGVPV